MSDEKEKASTPADVTPDLPADTDTENAAPASTPPSLKKIAGDIFDVLELFVFCAAVILCVFTFIVRPAVVSGESMEDTLLAGDYLLVTELGYTPQNGDIVVAHNTALPLYSDPIVKRVIATPGQTIDIDFETWTVTVDGVELDESYRKLTSGLRRTSDFAYPMVIPEGYVFVMGDNRNHSADSRSADIGLIDERCIVGHALIRVFPFSRITLFD